MIAIGATQFNRGCIASKTAEMAETLTDIFYSFDLKGFLIQAQTINKNTKNNII